MWTTCEDHWADWQASDLLSAEPILSSRKFHGALSPKVKEIHLYLGWIWDSLAIRFISKKNLEVSWDHIPYVHEQWIVMASFQVSSWEIIWSYVQCSLKVKEKKKRYYEMLRKRLSLHHFKSWHFCLMWSISIVHIIIQWDKLLYKIFGSKSEHFTKLLYLNNTHTHRVVEKAWGLSP